MALADLKVKISIEGAVAAVSALEGVERGVKNVASAAGGALSSGISSAASGLQNLAAIAVGATAAVAGLATAVGFNAAVKLDSLTRGLASVSKNAEDLQGQLTRLREIAKLPGLAFEEAVHGSLRLQATGISAELAERSLIGFANAVSRGGGGKADFAEAIHQLTQIASQGKLAGDELRVIAERVPGFSNVIRAAFGSVDSKAINSQGLSTVQIIEKITSAIEKLPKVTGGIANDIENMRDGIKNALVPLGQGLISLFSSIGGTTEKTVTMIQKLATSIGQVMAAVGKSGELQKAFSKLFGSGAATDMQDGILRAVANVLAVIGNLRGAFDTIGSNLGEGVKFVGSLFDNLALKAKLTFTLMVDGVSMVGKAMGMVFSFHIQGFKNQLTTLLGVLGVTGTAIMKLLEKSPLAVSNQAGLNALKAGFSGTMEAYQMGLKGVDAASPIYSPNFKSINLLGGADDIYNNLKKNLGPMASLPDGLSYGGGGGGIQQQAQSASSSIWAQWDKYLAGIEKNTQRTANILDSRRSIGGGDLARAGVSGAEMARVNDARYRRLYGRG